MLIKAAMYYLAFGAVLVALAEAKFGSVAFELRRRNISAAHRVALGCITVSLLILTWPRSLEAAFKLRERVFLAWVAALVLAVVVAALFACAAGVRL